MPQNPQEGRRTPPISRGKRNRKRHDLNGPIRRACIVVLFLEALFFLLFYPGFWVRNVQVDGLETLTPAEALAATGLHPRTNIFVAAFHVPVVRNVEKLTVVDHVSRAVELPGTLVLHVAERRPYAVLWSNSGYWLMDDKRVPYASEPGPVNGLPTIKATDLAASEPVALGTQIRSDWLAQAYSLLSLLSNKQSLQPKLITVDQNANLCLNRLDNLRINIGSPDDLPSKVWSADVIARTISSADVAKTDYVDVTSPTHTALMLRRG